MRITKEDVKVRFDEYNKLYFGGCLPPCECHLIREKRNTFGTYLPLHKRGKFIGTIWISYYVDWKEEELREVIVHEMIHHYVQMIEGHKGGLFGHNWRFKRQCRRLKKEYGLNIRIHLFGVYHTWQKKRRISLKDCVGLKKFFND